ncbi:MarR family winged helix-turn-helix transcriptional regulator [Allorhizobium sp. BGMRC 0089]|uniref:MarR family winged helix-turn-helix transcriptional regulator n=1 Tax=Allorhizobium sonneratiae TaxID=2934936 RepID=UPI002033284D|nr:MarR family winged helix-turn-helix transcriptional regulator [Allorhizobium sonneratiae]MCM2291508.1 MarR family winged helix-turn-helix transcriptional regulator [Allorhizobium sonneratiae]
MHIYAGFISRSISVQNTPNKELLAALHDAVLDIVAVINRPDRDERLIEEAGIRLDRALFPLLVLTERIGPIGVVELAARVGRDHSTVSRQVAKLVALGLIERRPGATDARQRELRATLAGQAMARQIDDARERLTRAALTDWSQQEVWELAQSLRRYADALTAL